MWAALAAADTVHDRLAEEVNAPPEATISGSALQILETNQSPKKRFLTDSPKHLTCPCSAYERCKSTTDQDSGLLGQGGATFHFYHFICHCVLVREI